MGIGEEKSFAFAVKIVKAMKKVREQYREYDLTRQLVRSGTSIGANIGEAQKAQSTKDFISKLSIASKEAEEARYWIRLLIATEYLEEAIGNVLLADADELIRILTSSVKTAQKKENLNT